MASKLERCSGGTSSMVGGASQDGHWLAGRAVKAVSITCINWEWVRCGRWPMLWPMADVVAKG
eukprot:678872-Prymnesium_polylepis.1